MNVQNKIVHHLKYFPVLNSLIDTHLPYHSVKSNSNDQPWITETFHHLIKRRQFYFQSGNEIMFRMYRNKVNRERKRLKQHYVSKTLHNLKTVNPKKWWDCIKFITGKATMNRMVIWSDWQHK